MKTNELINLCTSLVEQSENTNAADVRKKAEDYYFGKPFGNEKPGNSQVVMKELQDAIEWLMPQLISVFMSDDEVVQFAPRTFAEVDDASEATRYVNQVITQDNDGFRIFNDWFRDALLHRNGVVTYYWDDKALGEEVELFSGLTESEYNTLLTEYEDQDNTRVVFKDYTKEGVKYYDVSVYTAQGGQVVIENVDPDAFRIDKNAKSIKTARFVGQERLMTLSELRSLGYKNFDGVEYADSDDTTDDITQQRIKAKDTDADREVLVRDLYVRVDYNGDGVNELRHVLYSGTELFENEEVSLVPYADITPQLVPHKFEGLSIADALMDLQEIKSTIMRNILDNMYLANHGRMLAMDGQVNLKDLQSSRPNQIVRTKSTEAVKPLPHASLDSNTFSVIDYIDKVKESRSGVNSQAGGINANLLNPQVTNDAIATAVTQAQRRIELIARTFAETGIKKLFLDVKRLLIENSDEEVVFEYRGEWKNVSPVKWKPSSNVKIHIGLGVNSREAKVAKAKILLDTVKEMFENDDFADSSVTKENLFNAYVAFLNAQGIYDTTRYVQSPLSAKAQANKMLAEMEAKNGLMNELVRNELGLTEMEQESAERQFNREVKEFELQSKTEIEVYKLKLKEKELKLREMELELKYNKSIKDENVTEELDESLSDEMQDLELATDASAEAEDEQLEKASQVVAAKNAATIKGEQAGE